MMKKILIALAFIIAVPLIAALFIKKEYQVVAQTTINQPVAVVFDYIRFLTNQDNYSVWAAMDPNMQKSAEGVDGTVGYISRWRSENPDVGVGEAEIKAITENSRIDFELRFIEPFSAVAPAYMTTEATEQGQTKVSWGFHGKMPYPMNLMLVFVDVENMILQDLQTGLDNLKLIMEAPQESPQ